MPSNDLDSDHRIAAPTGATSSLGDLVVNGLSTRRQLLGGGGVALTALVLGVGGAAAVENPPSARGERYVVARNMAGGTAAGARQQDTIERFTHNGYTVQLLGQRTAGIEKLVDLITKRMETAHHHELAVAVVNDSKLVASIYCSVPSAGMVDVGRPWCIGSTTKALANMALLRLVEDGRISVDTPVVPFLKLTPVFPNDGQDHTMDPRWSRIRVRDCMNHGFTIAPAERQRVKGPQSWDQYAREHSGKPFSLVDNFERFRYLLQFDLTKEPGSETVYGGLGGDLVGLLLESLGTARADVVMKRFFADRCDVRDAICTAYSDQISSVDPSLYGYSFDESTGQFKLNTMEGTPPWIGCGVCTGAWWMPVESLARIGAAINRGDVFKNPRRMFDLMLSTRSADKGFACGWNCPADPRGGVYLLKDGCVDGFNSTLWLGYGSPRSAIAVCGDCGASTNEICYFVGDLDRAGAFAGLPDQWENCPKGDFRSFPSNGRVALR